MPNKVDKILLGLINCKVCIDMVNGAKPTEEDIKKIKQLIVQVAKDKLKEEVRLKVDEVKAILKDKIDCEYHHREQIDNVANKVIDEQEKKWG